MDIYEAITKQGLRMDHYWVLQKTHRGEPLPNLSIIRGLMNVLQRKGFMDNGTLTVKAIDLLTMVESATPSKKNYLPTLQWAVEFHQRCQQHLKQLTGKVQVTDRIKGGKSYSFLCNPQDLLKNITKVMKLYDIKDTMKIEQQIFRHMNDCHRAGSWFPILYYYIFKDGKSELVTDMENDIPDVNESVHTIETFI